MIRVAHILASVFERPQIWAASKENDARNIYDLIDALLGASGEVSGATLARKILDKYFELDEEGRYAFFKHLASELDVNPADIRITLAEYEREPTKQAYSAFMAACEPKRQELVRRLNQVPAATGRLVDMRRELLKFAKKDAQLSVVDLDFKHLFMSWFNRGFLVLSPINWQTSADVLEKIIKYEAVHEINSWEELRGRLRPKDRRCFAFFHPAIPDEPLIFVEVAISKGIPNSIQDVLSDEREIVDLDKADTAVFYSISNCQAGLAGISFGNSLIKQVVADLAREIESLKHFVTLSPIPGFRNWLSKSNQNYSDFEDADIQELAASYLTNAKNKDGWPYDPVARFHLGNGAMIHGVHANADVSEKGKNQSFGVMVNYLYDLKQITSNHEGYAADKHISISAKVDALSKAGDKKSIKGI